LACTSKCGVLATYQPGEGIFLDERLKPETNLFDRSVLLHELVHYVQELNHERGDAKPCERWYHREVEAYAIQKTFLMLVGSPVRVGYSANKSTCDALDDQQASKSYHQ
jgi:predicted HD phosphohydrolase